MISGTNVQHARIKWVDIAKAIAILLMVIGHEVKNIHIYAFIFSFHMPLFFILSGYTSSYVNSWEKFYHKAKKTFSHVWLLAVLMVFLLGIEDWVIVPNFTVVNFWHNVLMGIFWGTNIPSLGMFGVGIMWFLFVFFWSKLLFDLLQVLIPCIYAGIILFALSGIAMFWCQNVAHWLPQAMDIVPIAALFMWMGAFIKKNIDLNHLNKLTRLVFVALILIWILCFSFNIYLEFAERHYPYYFLPIIEAVGGTIATCVISKWLLLSKLSKLLQIIGKHTLAIMCVHQLDLYWVIWSQYIRWWPFAAILRLILDLTLLAIVLAIQRSIKNRERISC